MYMSIWVGCVRDNTYTGNLDTCRKVRGAGDLLFCAVQAIEKLAALRRQGGQNFGSFPTHTHQADGRLGVGLGNAFERDINSIRLSIEPRRLVIAIAATLAVIHNDHNCLQRHLGSSFPLI